MKREEQGQQPEMRKKITPGFTEQSNDMDTSVGGAGVSYAEKVGWTLCVIEWSNDADTCIGGASRRDAEKTGIVQSIESRQCYETR